MSAPNSSDRNQYATFEVGGEYLGIRVLQVQEVLRRLQVTPVPLAPPVVAGLINLRGQIIPALELRRLFHLDERTDPEQALSVVLRTDAGAVTVQVDDIGDVVEIESTAVQPPPLHVEAHLKRCLSGVCQMKDRMLLLLDVARTVDVSAAYSPNTENELKRK